MTYPDCTRLYTGPNYGTSIFVVGRNTEFERLFPRTEQLAAEEWAKLNRVYLENLPTTGLCYDAVVDTLGA